MNLHHFCNIWLTYWLMTVTDWWTDMLQIPCMHTAQTQKHTLQTNNETLLCSRTRLLLGSRLTSTSAEGTVKCRNAIGYRTTSDDGKAWVKYSRNSCNMKDKKDTTFSSKNKAVMDRRLCPRCCHLWSYFKHSTFSCHYIWPYRPRSRCPKSCAVSETADPQRVFLSGIYRQVHGCIWAVLPSAGQPRWAALAYVQV